MGRHVHPRDQVTFDNVFPRSPLSAPLTEYHSVIENYKPTHSIFRRLSREACSAPQSFACQNVPPKLLSARVARHPISPLARIWSAVIRNTAAANAALQDAEADWSRADLDDVYTEEDLQRIRESYAEIPAGVRPLLQGRMMHSVITQAAFWKKREGSILPVSGRVADLHSHHPYFFLVRELRRVSFNVLHLLLIFEPMEEIEVRLYTS
jgi:hypothetical protein